MLDDNARRIVAIHDDAIEANRRRTRRAHEFPVDTMPVDVNEVAYYRNRYLEALAEHSRTLTTLRRMIVLGGNETADLWARIDPDQPFDDLTACDCDGRRNPRSADPG